MKDIIAFGPVEEAAEAQLTRCLQKAEDEARGVLCADHHKGYSMPIGGVLASQTVVMPAGVGYDIGCGNCAVQTSIKAEDIRKDLPKLMDEVYSKVSFGVGRKNNEQVKDAIVFDSIAHSPVKEQRALLQLAKDQLGTVGSGNHYVDLLEDRANGTVWVGVHFGSRGFGHKTACGFLALAQGKEWGDKASESMDAPPDVIPLDTALAEDYLKAMEIAGEYAYAGRDWVVGRVLEILGAEDDVHQYVHNHHNFAWWEEHNGEKWLVVRKGATPAFPGQLGFVGGSMGDDAVIIRGVDSDTSRTALYSTVHGAGRVLGRMEAKGKFKKGVMVRAPKVNWDHWRMVLKDRGIEIRGGGADEAPQCYKRLDDVLGYHKGTIEVLHTLKPIGVAMAGANEFDPYKD